jgi:hypothetical protein
LEHQISTHSALEHVKLEVQFRHQSLGSFSVPFLQGVDKLSGHCHHRQHGYRTNAWNFESAEVRIAPSGLPTNFVALLGLGAGGMNDSPLALFSDSACTQQIYFTGAYPEDPIQCTNTALYTVGELPENCRHAMVLCYLEGLSQSEAADRLADQSAQLAAYYNAQLRMLAEASEGHPINIPPGEQPLLPENSVLALVSQEAVDHLVFPPPGPMTRVVAWALLKSQATLLPTLSLLIFAVEKIGAKFSLLGPGLRVAQPQAHMQSSKRATPP